MKFIVKNKWCKTLVGVLGSINY